MWSRTRANLLNRVLQKCVKKRAARGGGGGEGLRRRTTKKYGYLTIWPAACDIALIVVNISSWLEIKLLNSGDNFMKLQTVFKMDKNYYVLQIRLHFFPRVDLFGLKRCRMPTTRANQPPSPFLGLKVVTT